MALLPWAAEHNGSDPVSGWDIHYVCERSHGRRLSHVLVGSSAKNPGDRWPCIRTRVWVFSLPYLLFLSSSQIIQSSSLLRGSEVTQGHSECVVKTALFLIGSILGDRQGFFLHSRVVFGHRELPGWVSSRLGVGFRWTKEIFLVGNTAVIISLMDSCLTVLQRWPDSSTSAKRSL